MPRARARPRPTDDEEQEEEQCRCEGCEGRRRRGDAARADADAAAPSALGLAAIRQERGLPRCLVLVGEGLLQDLEEAQAEDEEEGGEQGGPSASQRQRQREPRLPHLDRVAREGMLTPLQLRDSSQRPEDGGGGASSDKEHRRRRRRSEAVAAQFWGSAAPAARQKQLAARFKGLRALALTATADPSSAFGAAAASVGAAVRTLRRPGEQDDDGDATPRPERAARNALEALGLLELPAPGPGEAEMVVLHVDAGAGEEDEEEEDDATFRRRRRRRRLLRWLDRTARAAFELGGEAARDALLLAVVLTPRDAVEDEGRGVAADDDAPPPPAPAVLGGQRRCLGASNDDDDDDPPPPSLPRPLQSGQLLASSPIQPLSGTTTALCARRLPGAVRRCGAERFSAREARARGEGGVLMERLLPELAYKLGRAAKYGA
jgi:hypothetical protein